MKKIIGQKINLRDINPKDAQSIYDNIKDKRITRYLLTKQPYTIKMARDFIKRVKVDDSHKKAYHFGIEDKKTKKIIGMVGLRSWSHEHRHAEVGYWLGLNYQRQGIMSEALTLVLDFAFKKVKLNRVQAGVMRPNVASAQLLKKLGFKYEGCSRRHFFRNGRWQDDLRFAILKEEYKTKKTRRV